VASPLDACIINSIIPHLSVQQYGSDTAAAGCITIAVSKYFLHGRTPQAIKRMELKLSLKG
jgi:hypothetical protein